MKVLESITSLEELKGVFPNLFEETETLEETVLPEETETLEEIPEETLEDEGPDLMAEVTKLQETIRDMAEKSHKAERQARLETELQKSDLPEPVRKKLARRFAPLGFTDKDLKEVIKEEKEVLAELIPPERRIYPNVKIGENAFDKFQKGLEGMFEGEDIDGVPAFHNLKQAYARFVGRPVFEVNATEILAATGHPYDSAIPLREATISTGSWANVFGTSINRQLLKEYRKPRYDDWRKVCSSVQTLGNLKAQERARTGGYGALATVAEAGPYTAFISPGDEMQNYTPAKRGKLEGVTLEAIANDDLNALRRIPRSMAFSAKVGLYRAVFDIFPTNAAMNYDTTALFDVATHANRGSSPLSDAALTAVKVAMMQQMEPVGALETQTTYLDVEPKYLVVPLNLGATAHELIDNERKIVARSDATLKNPHYKTLEVIVVRHWTDLTDWYVVGDPGLIATIEVGFYGPKEPQMFTEVTNTGQSFTNDIVRYKVRHIFGLAALEHRGMYGSIVAG